MNYEPLIERDLPAIRRAVREFRDAHGPEEAWKAIARFAVLAYAPAQHAKHALLCSLAAWEIREELGGRFDDALVECAIYTATSRQPWSEPPMLDPPPVDHTADLREAVRHGDRLQAERWLASHYDDDDFPRHYFSVAADDFEDLGHKLIVANAAWKLAGLLGEKGRYAALRVGVWEMVAYRGEPYRERGGAVTAEMLADTMVACHGDLESAHAVFLFDAARETEQETRVSDYLATLTRPPATLSRSAGEGPGCTPLPRAGEGPRSGGEGVPIYRYARDCGEYLKSHAAAKRLGIDRIIAAAWENLEHGPSLEAFSFA